ncbi:MAG: NAD(P)/FAD-dependent oxidoreductase [Flavobacteriales bacterium]
MSIDYIDISLTPENAFNREAIESELNKLTPLKSKTFTVVKRSIDARSRQIVYRLRVAVHQKNENPFGKLTSPDIKNVTSGTVIVIIGAGPAGLFAALQAIEKGLKPVVFERGKNVRERRRDLAAIHKKHLVNPESNYCFGEGGAGTYSDGKLYTRSKKRGSVLKVLETLVKFGASTDILIDAHPHIGTNKLPGIIENIRNYIQACGGEVHFNSKLTDIEVKKGKIRSITINETKIEAKNVILATGHSARDIFELLYNKKILIESKPFALGVRIEHPQKIIDRTQYKCEEKGDILPPAAYSLVAQVNGRGVYSFCMCPGGIIAPCATKQEEVVTNGWSPSKRNNPYANSGIVTEIRPEDYNRNQNSGPLSAMKFQSEIEQKCWNSAGKTQHVPAQRMIDFIEQKKSADLPQSSYQPGVVSVNLWDALPHFVCEALAGGLKEFGSKMKGYLTNDAVLHAPESRTSSPVRIPRDKETLQHPEVEGLFPCGEGAGYAGGIVSAAIDGINCVEKTILST